MKFKMSVTNYDFCGWATRNDLRCSDGRVIRKNAFADCDGNKVPLVWQHDHDNPSNVLGHAILENRPEGVFMYGYFNNTEAAQNTKELVKNGDISSISIWANKLKQKGGDVLHGVIREVSLVLSGANPGAYITDVPSLAHGEDNGDFMDAILYTGEDIIHMDTSNKEPEEPVEPKSQEDDKMPNKPNKPNNSNGSNDTRTVQDVFDEMTEEQKNVVYFLIGQALEDAGVSNDEGEEGEGMKHNVFQNDDHGTFLSHDDMKTILNDAKRCGSLKEAVIDNLEDGVLAHANYGIDHIDYLFQDARMVKDTPDFISREMGWVRNVIDNTHHTPFSRIKSVHADVTADEARAKGYTKGSKKIDEVFSLLKRTTDPQTIYKTQKIDRDDKLDITGFDVVAWIKGEMRMMLDEEIARAILIGDGKLTSDNTHISTDHVRPIVSDDDLYTIKAAIKVAHGASNDDKAKEFIKTAVRSRKDYKGKGNPVLYTTEDFLSDMLLLEDTIGHRLYKTETELATAMRVSSIVSVPVMDNTKVKISGTDKPVAGIIVNLYDYNVGADKGGEVNMFDDFDINYNQEQYLIETRISGALVTPHSAITLFVDEAGA